MDGGLVTLLVACLGTGGAGLMLREIFDIISKVRAGVSTKENKRKTDIVGQRMEALREAAAAKLEAEEQRALRIKWQEYTGILLYLLRTNGISPTPLPAELEDTLGG